VAVVNPKDGQRALHIAAAYNYPEVVVRILLEGESTRVRDRRGKSPIDYAQGELVRWILRQFEGREPKLDAAVRKHRDRSFEPVLLQTEGASLEVKELYLQYARQLDDGRLHEEVMRLARLMSSQDIVEESRTSILQRFNIARFLLARSDAPIALEAIRQETDTSVHVGLVLLGLKVDNLEYKSGELLRVNGHDVLAEVDRAIHIAVQSSQTFDVTEFEQIMEDVCDLVHGRSVRQASGVMGSHATDSAMEQIDKVDDYGKEETLEL